jgi:hypothetical protein
MTIDTDEIERAIAGRPNRGAHIERIVYLLKHAQRGNWAWYLLEEEYGFTGDYIPGFDDGEPVREY